MQEVHVVAKFNPSHGVNFWVRCASGNVYISLLTKVGQAQHGLLWNLDYKQAGYLSHAFSLHNFSRIMYKRVTGHYCLWRLTGVLLLTARGRSTWINAAVKAVISECCGFVGALIGAAQPNTAHNAALRKQSLERVASEFRKRKVANLVAADVCPAVVNLAAVCFGSFAPKPLWWETDTGPNVINWENPAGGSSLIIQ